MIGLLSRKQYILFITAYCFFVSPVQTNPSNIDVVYKIGNVAGYLKNIIYCHQTKPKNWNTLSWNFVAIEKLQTPFDIEKFLYLFVMEKFSDSVTTVLTKKTVKSFPTNVLFDGIFF